MRFVRSSRLVRPGSRPARGRPRLPLVAGGGGGAPTSNGAPSAASGTNASTSSAIFPANWSGATGDAFLMAFSLESFTADSPVPPISFTPTEGSVIAFAEANDGTTYTACGLWFIDSYSGSGNPDLTPAWSSGAVNTCYNHILYWDVSAGATAPTQCLAYDEFCEVPSSGSTTYAGADGGTWSRTGTALDGPAIDVISDGTNWMQGRMFYAGDDDNATDTDTFYDAISFLSNVAGTDMTVGIARKTTATPFAANDGTITQADFGTAVAIGGMNLLLGT